jgi:serine/threonine protein kinase
MSGHPTHETKERLVRLESLFFDALAMPEDQIPAFLDDVCGEDQDLRTTLEEMIAADQDRSGLIDTAPWSPEQIGRRLAIQAGEDRFAGEGTQVGRYLLLDLVGEGGMGTVWRARRADEGPERIVALKLIREAAHTPATVQRFRKEEQVLARLEHPNIARLYDGGTTELGRPYFVMEYVQGVPITEYALRHALTVEQRLRLVQKVCEAVQYAHGSLVLHRDIKPANILVTSEGTPKLLDFGIAKILEDSDSPATNITQTEARVLTPRYASPEQIRGDRLSVATDVYSLGVVLYELLTGCNPHEADSGTRHALERAILEKEIVKPSGAVQKKEAQPSYGHRAWARRLRGDVDTVCMMALRKSPRQRYRSALELGEDIRRHLQGLPLLARPPGPVARLARSVSKRRGSIVASIIGALLGIGLMTAYGVQAFLVPGWQEEHVRQARLAIVGDQANTVIYNLLFFSYVGWNPDQIVAGEPDSRLLAARESYAKAMNLGDVSETGVGEEAMLRLADAVRNAPEQAHAILESLPYSVPLTEIYVAQLTDHRQRAAFTAPQRGDASMFDLRCLGFVALFLGDQLTTIDSWSSLSLTEPDPVVEALLGYVHLALNEPELAYGRLLSAYRAYTESGALAIYLADAAVRSGDLALAGHLLEVTQADKFRDVHFARERIEGMYLLANGQEVAALEIFCNENVTGYNAVAAVQLARYMERTEGRESAIRTIVGRVHPLQGGSERATFEYFVSLMEAWWAETDEKERLLLAQAVVGNEDSSRRAWFEDALRRFSFAVKTLEDSRQQGSEQLLLDARSRWSDLVNPVDEESHESARDELVRLASRLPDAIMLGRVPEVCEESGR